MTREDIIAMAREAGIPIEIDWAGRPSTLVVKDGGTYLRGVDDLERFAALVAAAEREKVAAWMIQRSYATGHGDTTEDLLVELEWQIAERIAAEREACARAVEEESGRWAVPVTSADYREMWDECAAVIRAREQA